MMQTTKRENAEKKGIKIDPREHVIYDLFTE